MYTDLDCGQSTFMVSLRCLVTIPGADPHRFASMHVHQSISKVHRFISKCIGQFQKSKLTISILIASCTWCPPPPPPPFHSVLYSGLDPPPEADFPGGVFSFFRSLCFRFWCFRLNGSQGCYQGHKQTENMASGPRGKSNTSKDKIACTLSLSLSHHSPLSLSLSLSPLLSLSLLSLSSLFSSLFSLFLSLSLHPSLSLSVSLWWSQYFQG